MSIKAVIFDMDGVIIDSEALWQQAQMETLGDWGATVSVSECETLTKGKRLDEIARIWCRHCRLAIDPQQLAEAILQRIVAFISGEGKAMPGVYAALDYFRRQGYQTALATSSCHRVIAAVFDKLQLWRAFDVISSADDEPWGKPHPAVYLSTLGKLNLHARECLVIEDSLSGFLAAQAAGIATIVVTPDYGNRCFQEAAGRYDSLTRLLTRQPTAVVG